jgi:hypothetical protein
MAMPEVENRPMKLRRLVAAVGITLAISLLSVFLAGVVVVVVDQARMTYATPETQSPFLRSATLTPVLNRFSSTKYPSRGSDSSSSGAGYGFATHDREFHHYFAIKSSEREALMAALVESITSQLNSAGAQIGAETGDAAEGFQFDYVTGKSRGTIRIDPLKDTNEPQEARAYGQLCPGEVPVSVSIRIEEKWIKSGT